jgi:hypothetical protein
MFNFFRKIREYTKLAKTVDFVHYSIEDLILQVQYTNDYSQFKEQILLLAYFSKVGIIERMGQYNYNLQTPILIHSMETRAITLSEAYNRSVIKLEALAKELGYGIHFQNIFNEGTLYYDLKNKLPNSVTSNI